MGKRSSRKVIHFYNTTGDINNVIHFLEDIKKKINYLNLNCTVDGDVIKVTLFGPKDLQYLASDRLRELANRYL